MVFLNFYYLIKPLIPRRVQIALRRILVRRKLASVGHIWPIDEKAGRRPDGWPGWPEGKQFALVLTHDVESRRGLEKVLPLARMEKEMGFRSCFNFVGRDYPVYDQIRKTLADMGFEVGVHGLTHKGNLFRSRRVFESQKDLINKILNDWKAVGFRAPSMYHNLEWLGELDIAYDMSTFDTDPFEPQPDAVRTIFPFWVPSRLGKGFVELPTTLPQDHTLFIVMNQKDAAIWKQKLDWIAQKGGMALLNVHPDYISFDNQPDNYSQYPLRFYEDFLKNIKAHYDGCYWHPLPREVSQYFKKLVPCQGNKPFETDPRTSNLEPRTSLLAPPSSPLPPQKPLRVCMLVYSFYESDNRVMRYAETLARRGDHVEVIALRKPGAPQKEYFRGVHLYRIQGREKTEKQQLSYVFRIGKFILRSFIFLTRKHLQAPYDLIHVHNMPDFLVFIALFPKFLGAKIILDIHDVVPELYATRFKKNQKAFIYKIMLLLEKWSCHFADQVIIANHIWKERVVDRSVESKKCMVIMNYPDERIFYPRSVNKSKEKFILVYPGSLNRRQGVDIAIQAIALIKEKLPAVEFHIYGDGAGRTELETMVKELGLENRVHFKGSLPIYEIAEKISQADLGIEPKRNDLFAGDAMSTKILEFMAVGVPVIASDTRIHKYYFNDKVLVFFKSDDPVDLAKNIVELAGDQERRQRLVEEGLKFAEKYSWKNNQGSYLQLIESLTRVH